MAFPIDGVIQLNRTSRIVLSCFLLTATAFQAVAAPMAYTILVSKPTHDDAAWKQVVEVLVKKHEAKVIVYEGDGYNNGAFQ